VELAGNAAIAAVVLPAGHAPPAGAACPAGFVRRAIAFLIDFILIEFLYLVPAFFGLLGIYFSKGGEVSPDFIEPFIAIWIVLFIGYFSFFHAHTGQTPAKRIMRIKVINKEGAFLSHGVSLFRSVGYLFSFGFLGGAGFLMALFGKKKRALHDFITGSQVILSD
jgi:uncharacterized RDD family membrane protein YckC